MFLNKKIFFLAGLPRTGSTLLSSILSQNPKICASGYSPVCQLMWDMKLSCEGNSYQAILANNRTDTQYDLIKSIPYIYYKNINRKYILDKCRNWITPENLKLIKDYITPTPKIIVLTRNIDEILDSYSNIRQANGHPKPLKGVIDRSNDFIYNDFKNVEYAKNNNNGEFIFIDYHDFISSPKDTIDSIYDFFEIKRYNHYFKNIFNPYPENDLVYGLMGLHDIRPNIE
jgi:sulfotransferase